MSEVCLVAFESQRGGDDSVHGVSWILGGITDSLGFFGLCQSLLAQEEGKGSLDVDIFGAFSVDIFGSLLVFLVLSLLYH